MSKKKLEHLLAELEREIAGLRHVDARSLARLKEVEAELKEKITALESSVRHPDLLLSLDDWASEFEIQHPTLTNILSGIATTLRGMGF